LFCLYVPAPILPRCIFSHWPRKSHTQSRWFRNCSWPSCQSHTQGAKCSWDN
jgi:hypothetical protein